MNKVEQISSSTNSKFKIWKSLLQTKGIKEEKKYLIWGKTVVSEMLVAEVDDIDCVLISEEQSELAPSHLKTFILSKALFKELDIFGIHQPILVCKLPEIDTFTFEKTPGISLFLPLGDPNNLGAVLRTANAFGVESIVLLKEAAHPFHPKSVRAASGSLRHLKFFNGPSIHDLKTYKDSIHVLDGGGKDITSFDPPESMWLLVGEEGPGVPEFLKTKTLSIPIREQCESLNASIATAIALHELTKKLK